MLSSKLILHVSPHLPVPAIYHTLQDGKNYMIFIFIYVRIRQLFILLLSLKIPSQTHILHANITYYTFMEN